MRRTRGNPAAMMTRARIGLQGCAILTGFDARPRRGRERSLSQFNIESTYPCELRPGTGVPRQAAPSVEDACSFVITRRASTSACFRSSDGRPRAMDPAHGARGGVQVGAGIVSWALGTCPPPARRIKHADGHLADLARRGSEQRSTLAHDDPMHPSQRVPRTEPVPHPVYRTAPVS